MINQYVDFLVLLSLLSV